MILHYILSLFDGMSCGQIALKEIGIEFECYYSSEIDKHAIKQTQLNFPQTIQLGDITKWRQWDIDWGKVDLILAGSPCQGFSFAGKQLAFDDPRSKLFFEFVNILKHTRKYNPQVKYLLENVNMKHEYIRIINEKMGVFPVNINSALVSAQNRNRWYWTNIKTKMLGLFCEVYVDIPLPKDEGICLKDILEKEVDEKYYISQAVIDRMLRKQYSTPSLNPDKAGTLNTKNNSGQMTLDSGTTFIKIDIDGNIKPNQNKASCFTAGANSGGNHSDMDLICCGAMRGRNLNNPADRTAGNHVEQCLEPNLSGKTNCLTSVQKDNLVISGISRSLKKDFGILKTRENRQGQNILKNECRIRRLTPTECDKLQTIPAWYKWECSETQHYKMLGNGWTVKVIMHILKYLKP